MRLNEPLCISVADSGTTRNNISYRGFLCIDLPNSERIKRADVDLLL